MISKKIKEKLVTGGLCLSLIFGQFSFVGDFVYAYDNGLNTDIRELYGDELGDRRSTFESILDKYKGESKDKKLTIILQLEETQYKETIEKLKLLKDTKIKFVYEEIFKGVSLETTVAMLDTISKMKGISYAEEGKEVKPQMMTTHELINAMKVSKNYKHDGRGMVIAIVDSGIDTKHKDMRLDEGIEPKIKEVTKTVEGEYTMKIPHGYNYVAGNNSLIDETEYPHGMHIAGILAANATDEDVATNKGIDGIAPNAQILMYKVFSDREDTQVAVIDDTVFAAIEDAIKHDADVISLSIGSYGTGKPGDAFYKAIEKAKAKGIVVAASMGNASTSSSTTSYDKYTNDAFGQKDFATTVSVAANLDVIGVGSTRNKYQINDKLSISGNEFYYVPVSYTTFDKGEYTFVDAGKATSEDLKNLDLEGKVAIIGRSSESPKAQFDRLRNKGAIGAISYNNTTGRNRDFYETEMQQILDESVAVGIWGATVSHNDGKAILELIKENPRRELKPLGIKYSILQENNEVSGFSSWGTTVDLELKPDIVAPGERIYSTLNHNRYGIMSGTSMSTPVVAGAATILLPRFRNMNRPQEIDITNFTKIMMMNTAEPLFDTTGYENSPRQQGAGMLNVEYAFENNVLITHRDKGYVALKEIGNQTEFTVKLRNLGTDTEVFKVRSSDVLTSGITVATKEKGEKVNEVHSQKLENVTLDIGSKEITLNAGEEKEISFLLDATNADEQFVEGFIYFDSTTNPNLSIPYFAFKGNWNKDPIIDPPMWEEGSKMKLTALMSVYNDELAKGKEKVKPLGLKDINNPDSDIDPELVGITSKLSGGFTTAALFRVLVMRDLQEYEVSVVKEKADSAKSLRIIDRGNFLEKFRYIDYFENDYFRNKFSTPNSDKFRWDGKLYDASVGELVPAEEGQYYIRIKVKNLEDKEYQYTYLPVKVDNEKPTLSVEQNGNSYIIRTQDNMGIWFVRARVNNDLIDVVKVNDGEYRIDNIPYDPKSRNRMIIEAVDIGGNMATYEKVLSEPNIAFVNVKDVENRKRERSLEAEIKENVKSIEASLNGKSIDVTISGDKAEFDLDKIKDGRSTIVYILKDADGGVIEEGSLDITRDVKGPEVKFDVEYQEIDEDDSLYGMNILKSENGYAIIKGNVRDIITESRNIKIYHYNKKDKWNRDKHKLLLPDENGNFEFRVYLEEYPESIGVDFVDEKGNVTDSTFFTGRPREVEFNYKPITLSEIRTNNFLKDENLEDNLEELEVGEGEEPLYKYTIKFFADDDGYSVKINDGEQKVIDDELKYDVILKHGANIINIEGYDPSGKLILQKRINYFVDVNAPTYEIEDFRIMPVLPEETMKEVIGTVYLKGEDVLLKGYAMDDGLEWTLMINKDIVRRGKAWREFGQNREEFTYRALLKDNDLMSFRLFDFHGNETSHQDERYRVKIDNVSPEIVSEIRKTYKKNANINIDAIDNVGIFNKEFILDGVNFINSIDIDTIGNHTLIAKAEDYAGNKTVKTYSIDVIDELGMEVTKNEINKSDINNVDSWMQLKYGTRARIVDIIEEGDDYKIKVVLYNDLGEEEVKEITLKSLDKAEAESGEATETDDKVLENEKKISGEEANVPRKLPQMVSRSDYNKMKKVKTSDDRAHTSAILMMTMSVLIFMLFVGRKSIIEKIKK